MVDVHSVLLVPSPEHVKALLCCGPCGARPPMAHRAVRPMGADFEMFWCGAQPTETPWGTGFALVLAWEGETVPEGMDRVTCCVEKKGQMVDSEHEKHNNLFAANWIHQANFSDLNNKKSGVPALLLQFGTLVFLDANGKEIQP